MSPTETDTKNKALEAALSKIRSDHGEGAVMDMSGKMNQQVPSIPVTLPLDIALGIGGIPRGRIVELFGPESSGKTTLCYHALASVQSDGGTAAFIDTEHSMDAQYASRLGVDVDKLIVSQPDHGEQALQIAQLLTESGAVDLIVVDSVAALTPKAEIEGQVGDQSVGLQARMMSQACRMLAGKCAQTDTTLLFTNQIREKVGVFFGSPETQPGGRALKFYASQRLDIRRIETLKDGDKAIGNKVRVKVVKNKVAPPFRQAEFVIAFGVGVDREQTLIDMFVNDKDLKATGMVTKSGSFFKFTESPEPDKSHQGMAKATVYLKDNGEVADALEAKVRSIFLSPEEDADAEAPAEADEAATETDTEPAAA